MGRAGRRLGGSFLFRGYGGGFAWVSHSVCAKYRPCQYPLEKGKVFFSIALSMDRFRKTLPVDRSQFVGGRFK